MKKKKIAILRFGNPLPVKNEYDLIHEIAGEHLDVAMFVPLGHGPGILHLVYTELEPAEIARKFEEASTETSPLPVIVGEMESIILSLTEFPAFAAHIGQFNKEVEAVENGQPTQVKMNLDELLDLIANVGVANLTPEQHERLKILSQKF